MALAVTTAYETTKQSLFPDFSLWESHVVTIGYVTALSVGIAILVARQARRIAEEAEAASAARAKADQALRALVHAVGDPAFLIDENQICVATNAAMAERLGRPIEELIGKSIFQYVPDPVAAGRKAKVDEVLRTGVPTVFRDERNGRFFANHIYPARDPSGRVWAVAGVAHDVTEVTLAERALREREEILRLGFEAARMGVWEWDPVADTVAISPELAERIGGSVSIGGRGALVAFLDRIHPDDRTMVETSLRDCASGAVPLHHVRYRSARAPGVHRWHEAWARMFTDADGRSRMVGALKDITDEMASEAREREANAQIRRSEERFRTLNADLERRVAERTVALSVANQELEAFCYSVSHDLRAPLRSIDGFSLALVEDYDEHLDDEGKKYVGIIRAETQRMGRLIDDLLNLSRVSRTAMRRAPVDLGALARQILDGECRREPARQAEIFVAADLTAQGDESLLRIALTNLLTNAWKFTGRRALTRIDVGETVQDGQRTFFVRDNGAGFSMEHAGKLFEPFQRLHGVAEFEGTGVGLATVNRIVRRHGGRVWADSKVGEGATFFWTLPELGADAAPAKES